MKLTREQTVGAVLVGGAVVLGVAAWRRREERVVKCEDISNRSGGTLTDPCPTEGPVDVCTFDGDFAPWRERLSIQLSAVEKLRRNMEDLALLDESFYDAIQGYTATAASLISQWPPAWTSESDITPMLNQLRLGCDLLNQGNRSIVTAGRPEYVVQEDAVADTFADTAKAAERFFWLPILGVAAILGGAYYLGRKIAA
jgi:hypothetical protein